MFEVTLEVTLEVTSGLWYNNLRKNIKILTFNKRRKHEKDYRKITRKRRIWHANCGAKIVPMIL